MKVAFLAAANSVHTQRWVNGLAGRGHEVHLISAHAPLAAGFDARVRQHRLGRAAPSAYLLAAGELRTLLQRIVPDLLNAHYASGYGLLARRAGFRPLLLSLWGSDVYEFPRLSPLHRWLLRGNLRAATALASTSACMAREAAATFAHPRVFVTPFGVDETLFVPGRVDAESGTVVIGTVKTLARTYGVDLLIDAFALASEQLEREGGPVLRLEITGGGPEESVLHHQVERSGLAGRVTFHGAVPHARVPALLQRLDVYVALSRAESFGVAAVEAGACAKPVVVSDVDGFVEVVRDAVTGLIVPREDPAAAAAALVRLARDAALRERLGTAARDHVLQHYTWERSLDRMIEAYHAVAARS